MALFVAEASAAGKARMPKRADPNPSFKSADVLIDDPSDAPKAQR